MAVGRLRFLQLDLFHAKLHGSHPSWLASQRRSQDLRKLHQAEVEIKKKLENLGLAKNDFLPWLGF